MTMHRRQTPREFPPARRPLFAPLLLLASVVTLPARAADAPQPGNVAGPWSDYLQAGRFHVFSDSRIDREAPVWTELETLPQRVEETLGLSRQTTTFRVYLLRSRSEFQSAVARRFPDGIDRRALYIAEGDRHEIFVYRHLEFVTDLRHEAVHAILHAALPYLPLWLDEGLAAYFEIPPGQPASAHPYRRRLRWDWLLLRRRPDLRRLEGIDDPMALSAADYRECWGWTFWLLGRTETRKLLQEYLQAIAAGDPPGRFSDRLGAHVADPTAAMMQTVKSPPSPSPRRRLWRIRLPFPSRR
ncbi:MAG: hypothetical protein D6725_11835 [Planctomycetota bacterium]|nr:MAG: hypothetical protein D6725_11835 [Planctomycetota bacterium]